MTGCKGNVKQVNEGFQQGCGESPGGHSSNETVSWPVTFSQGGLENSCIMFSFLHALSLMSPGTCTYVVGNGLKNSCTVSMYRSWSLLLCFPNKCWSIWLPYLPLTPIPWDLPLSCAPSWSTWLAIWADFTLNRCIWHGTVLYLSCPTCLWYFLSAYYHNLWVPVTGGLRLKVVTGCFVP